MMSIYSEGKTLPLAFGMTVRTDVCICHHPDNEWLYPCPYCLDKEEKMKKAYGTNECTCHLLDADDMPCDPCRGTIDENANMEIAKRESEEETNHDQPQG